MPMFGLADVNSFYASCEALFRPDLRGQAVVVLSNNDGCVIARSADYVELKGNGSYDLKADYVYLLKLYRKKIPQLRN